jgi:threonine dehydrogenase-like Zn-dependent dehydrogenase
MRAVAVFPGTRDIRVIERPEPAPLKGSEVLLRILEVGMCGTDREIADFVYGTPPPGSDHLILGHEAVAEVADVGPEVAHFRKGELAVPTVRRPCPHSRCRPCRAGRQDFCVTGDFRERGIKEAHGFLQEWTVEEEDYLVPVPRKLAELAVLTEPLSVAAKAAEQVQIIQQRLPWERSRARSLTLGAGPVGLLGALSMVTNQFETYVFSLEPAQGERAELVRSFGATYLSGKDSSLEEVRKRFGTMDIIYEAVGISSVAVSALGNLGPNGVFVLTGVPALGRPIPVEADAVMRTLVLGNQLLLGTVNASRAAYELALRELEQAMFLFPQSMHALITHRSRIEEAPAFIRSRGGIKHVVQLATASPLPTGKAA